MFGALLLFSMKSEKLGGKGEKVEYEKNLEDIRIIKVVVILRQSVFFLLLFRTPVMWSYYPYKLNHTVPDGRKSELSSLLACHFLCLTLERQQGLMGPRPARDLASGRFALNPGSPYLQSLNPITLLSLSFSP